MPIEKVIFVNILT